MNGHSKLSSPQSSTTSSGTGTILSLELMIGLNFYQTIARFHKNCRMSRCIYRQIGHLTLPEHMMHDSKISTKIQKFIQRHKSQRQQISIRSLLVTQLQLSLRRTYQGQCTRPMTLQSRKGLNSPLSISQSRVVQEKTWRLTSPMMN